MGLRACMLAVLAAHLALTISAYNLPVRELNTTVLTWSHPNATTLLTNLNQSTIAPSVGYLSLDQMAEHMVGRMKTCIAQATSDDGLLVQLKDLHDYDGDESDGFDESERLKKRFARSAIRGLKELTVEQRMQLATTVIAALTLPTYLIGAGVGYNEMKIGQEKDKAVRLARLAAAKQAHDGNKSARTGADASSNGKSKRSMSAVGDLVADFYRRTLPAKEIKPAHATAKKEATAKEETRGNTETTPKKQKKRDNPGFVRGMAIASLAATILYIPPGLMGAVKAVLLRDSDTTNYKRDMVFDLPGFSIVCLPVRRLGKEDYEISQGILSGLQENAADTAANIQLVKRDLPLAIEGAAVHSPNSIQLTSTGSLAELLGFALLFHNASDAFVSSVSLDFARSCMDRHSSFLTVPDVFNLTEGAIVDQRNCQLSQIKENQIARAQAARQDAMKASVKTASVLVKRATIPIPEDGYDEEWIQKRAPQGRTSPGARHTIFHETHIIHHPKSESPHLRKGQVETQPSATHKENTAGHTQDHNAVQTQEKDKPAQTQEKDKIAQSQEKDQNPVQTQEKDSTAQAQEKDHNEAKHAGKKSKKSMGKTLAIAGGTAVLGYGLHSMYVNGQDKKEAEAAAAAELQAYLDSAPSKREMVEPDSVLFKRQTPPHSPKRGLKRSRSSSPVRSSAPVVGTHTPDVEMHNAEVHNVDTHNVEMHTPVVETHTHVVEHEHHYDLEEHETNGHGANGHGDSEHGANEHGANEHGANAEHVPLTPAKKPSKRKKVLALAAGGLAAGVVVSGLVHQYGSQQGQAQVLPQYAQLPQDPTEAEAALRSPPAKRSIVSEGETHPSSAIGRGQLVADNDVSQDKSSEVVVRQGRAPNAIIGFAAGVATGASYLGLTHEWPGIRKERKAHGDWLGEVRWRQHNCFDLLEKLTVSIYDAFSHARVSIVGRTPALTKKGSVQGVVVAAGGISLLMLGVLTAHAMVGWHGHGDSDRNGLVIFVAIAVAAIVAGLGIARWTNCDSGKHTLALHLRPEGHIRPAELATVHQDPPKKSIVDGASKRSEVWALFGPAGFFVGRLVNNWWHKYCEAANEKSIVNKRAAVNEEKQVIAAHGSRKKISLGLPLRSAASFTLLVVPFLAPGLKSYSQGLLMSLDPGTQSRFSSQLDESSCRTGVFMLPPAQSGLDPEEANVWLAGLKTAAVNVTLPKTVPPTRRLFKRAETDGKFAQRPPSYAQYYDSFRDVVEHSKLPPDSSVHKRMVSSTLSYSVGNNGAQFSATTKFTSPDHVKDPEKQENHEKSQSKGEEHEKSQPEVKMEKTPEEQQEKTPVWPEPGALVLEKRHLLHEEEYMTRRAVNSIIFDHDKEGNSHFKATQPSKYSAEEGGAGEKHAENAEKAPAGEEHAVRRREEPDVFYDRSSAGDVHFRATDPHSRPEKEPEVSSEGVEKVAVTQEGHVVRRAEESQADHILYKTNGRGAVNFSAPNPVYSSVQTERESGKHGAEGGNAVAGEVKDAPMARRGTIQYDTTNDSAHFQADLRRSIAQVTVVETDQQLIRRADKENGGTLKYSTNQKSGDSHFEVELPKVKGGNTKVATDYHHDGGISINILPSGNGGASVKRDRFVPDR